MSTYSYENPSASPKDEVRFLLNLTDVSGGATTAFVSDEEINYAITLVYGSTPPASGNYLPAAYVADSISAKFSQAFDSKSVGDLSISYANRSQRFKDIAANLRMRANLASVPMYVGGASKAEKQAFNDDTDQMTTAVKIDGMNFPGTTNTDNRWR